MNLKSIISSHALYLIGDPAGERANLQGAYLPDANLQGTNLQGTNLQRANLLWANLQDANLQDAYLQWANLQGAYLLGANLQGANLSGTCLDPLAPIPPISDEDLTRSGLVIDGDIIRGWRTSQSQHCGSTVYAPSPDPYVAPAFSVAPTDCHPGIYLAGQAWLEQNYSGAEIVPCHCLRSELHMAGGKFRAKRLWIDEEA